MKHSNQTVRAGHPRPALHAALAIVMLGAAALAQAVTVVPPLLPPGSAMVKVEPGMDKQERKREDRAHHHKGHNKKDITRDDSEDNGNGKDNGNNDNKGSKK